MTEPTVLYDHAGGVAMLTLNRPDKLNSFTATMHRELAEAIARAEREGARALLLTGAGRGFCAGQDLGERAGGTAPDLGETLDKLYNPLIRKLRALNLPVIGAINGVAAGAGMSIALACDIVLAAQSATFLQAFAKIGLVPDSGSTWMLPRLIGPARARALTMLAEKITADEAVSLGLIWRAIPDDRLMSEARALARRMAAAPTRAIAGIKQAIERAADNSLDEQLDLERDMQRELGRSADYREGVAAFLAKRTPEFKGR